MKNTNKRKSFSGVVLIMVMTVMFVLTIMLMATLTVVSTANKRVFLKYEENQAYYSAMTGLDVFLESILNSGDYHAALGDTEVAATYEWYDTVSETYLTDMPLLQNGALWLETYKIQAKNTEFGMASNMEFDYSPARAGGAVTAWNGYFSVANPPIDYIDYKVKYPPVGGGAAGAETLFADNNEGTIRVEVEYRRYRMVGDTDEDNGFGVNFTPMYTDAQLTTPGGVPAATLRDVIHRAPRGDDEIILKITSTATLAGVEGSVSVYIDARGFSLSPGNPGGGGGGNGLQTLSSMVGGSGAAMGPHGDGSSLDPGEIDIGDGHQFSGSFYSRGSLNWVSNQLLTMGENDSIVMEGNVTLGNNFTVRTLGTGAFFFAGGSFTAGGGTVDFPDPGYESLDIITTIFNLPTNSGVIRGNIYADEIRGGTGPNFIVYGDVYAGSITDEARARLTIMDEITGEEREPNIGTVFAFDVSVFGSPPDEEGLIFRYYTLADGKEIVVPTAQSKFNRFFPDGSFDDKGFFIEGSTPYNGAHYAQEAIGSTYNTMSGIIGEIQGQSKYKGDLVSGDIDLDSESGDFIYTMSNAYSNGGLKVTVSGGYNAEGEIENRLIILIDDDQEVRFAGNNWIRYDEFPPVSGAGPVSAGDRSPPIYIYGGNNSYYNCDEPKMYLTGHIIMPTGKVRLEDNTLTTDYILSSGETVPNVKTNMIGSVICGDFISISNPGILALGGPAGTSASESDPWDPEMKPPRFTPIQYSRR